MCHAWGVLPTVGWPLALHCPLHTALRVQRAAWILSDGSSHVVERSFVMGMTFLEHSGRCARLPV